MTNFFCLNQTKLIALIEFLNWGSFSHKMFSNVVHEALFETIADSFGYMNACV